MLFVFNVVCVKDGEGRRELPFFCFQLLRNPLQLPYFGLYVHNSHRQNTDKWPIYWFICTQQETPLLAPFCCSLLL